MHSSCIDTDGFFAVSAANSETIAVRDLKTGSSRSDDQERADPCVPHSPLSGRIANLVRTGATAAAKRTKNVKKNGKKVKAPVKGQDTRQGSGFVSWASSRYVARSGFFFLPC